MRSYPFITATYPLRWLIAPLARGIIFLRRKRILLVFGMSRSGTSMLSKFLALGPTAILMHEPEVELLRERFGKDRFFTQEIFWNFAYSEAQREFKVHSLVCITMLAVLKAAHDVKTIVIKPIALTDVMQETCEVLPHAEVVYICRHPAGRSESILRQAQHDQGIQEVSLAVLEELGRDWGQTQRRIQALFEKHPGWNWVSFEALTTDPLGGLYKLYKRLCLPWSEQIAAEIEQRTAKDGGYYAVQRDSKKQADKWRESLTAEQVEAIRKGSLPFETNLYEGF